jgi:hypothetical protein
VRSGVYGRVLRGKSALTALFARAALTSNEAERAHLLARAGTV